MAEQEQPIRSMSEEEAEEIASRLTGFLVDSFFDEETANQMNAASLNSQKERSQAKAQQSGLDAKRRAGKFEQGQMRMQADLQDARFAARSEANKSSRDGADVFFGDGLDDDLQFGG